MFRLSKKADYALMALRHLALPDGPSSTSAREIAEHYDIPVQLMAKVLQQLVRAGLLISTRGTQGGYSLSRSPMAINAADVIQSIDGPLLVTACSLENDNCDQYDKCGVRLPLWQIRERIEKTLETVTIAEMAAESNAVRVPVTNTVVIKR